MLKCQNSKCQKTIKNPRHAQTFRVRSYPNSEEVKIVLCQSCSKDVTQSELYSMGVKEGARLGNLQMRLAGVL